MGFYQEFGGGEKILDVEPIPKPVEGNKIALTDFSRVWTGLLVIQ